MAERPNTPSSDIHSCSPFCERPECVKGRESRDGDALEWYGEQAEALARYTTEKNTTAMMAVVTAIALDAGNRAKSAHLSEIATPTPILWWNGIRKFDERTLNGPSVDERESTNHDIPLYDGANKHSEFMKAARAAVIEECAKVCDSSGAVNDQSGEHARILAEAIRSLKGRP